jgi:L-glutamine:2-deoxy-scyllo-inosose/3-amino-2,3-dideoxy-scyllo-inosose aminotransferase
MEIMWMETIVRSGQWSWNGPHEKAFCDEFKAFIGTKHAVCMANGTVTLQCALQAVGVVPGDEVIVPGLTWVATAQAAMDIGATVVFVDIDPETLCMDAKAFDKAITPKTRAVIPVHLYGCMCDMDAILAVARRRRIAVVEDVAHQHGSLWQGRAAGSMGDIGSFSFQQSKILTSGEGGAVTCNDDAQYTLMHCLKHVGHNPEMQPGNRYGHNYRITEFQAAMLRAGLRRLPEQNRLREENAARLRAGLKKTGGPLRVARRDPRVTLQAYYGLTLHYDPRKAGGVSRQAYLQALYAEGIGFWAPYAPVYAAPLMNLYDNTSPIPFRDPGAMQDYRKLALPNVERAARETAMVLHQRFLLGTAEFTDAVIAAVDKVNHNLRAADKAYKQQLSAQAKTQPEPKAKRKGKTK